MWVKPAKNSSSWREKIFEIFSGSDSDFDVLNFQSNLDADSNVLPAPMRCSADKLRDTEAYLLGEKRNYGRHTWKFKLSNSLGIGSNFVCKLSLPTQMVLPSRTCHTNHVQFFASAENGLQMIMWIGLGVPQDWINDVFGVVSAAQIDIGKVRRRMYATIPATVIVGQTHRLSS